MSKSVALKTAFSKANVIEPIYTGGPVALTSDAKYIFTFLDQLVLTSVDSCARVCTFAGDSSRITALALSPNSRYLASFGDSFLLSIYVLPADLGELSGEVNSVRKVARAHEAPVHVAKVDPSGLYLASGSADGIVKVWDLRRGFATHSFKGHAGVISAIAFHAPSAVNCEPLHVITASVDTKIHIYQMSLGNTSSRPLYVLEGHTSVPRGLAVSKDGKWLLSGGRDGVVLLWDYEYQVAKGRGVSKSHFSRSPKTIPVFERVEALGLLPQAGKDGKNELRFYVAGEKGGISVWEAHTGTVVTSVNSGMAVHKPQAGVQNSEIVEVIHTREMLVSVHADQNIAFYSAATLQSQRCIIGYNDEIIDSSLLSLPDERDSILSLATNSSLIRLYSMKDFNSCLLAGHDDIVLCLKAGVEGRVLGSGSKDNTAQLWGSLDDKEMGWCSMAICEGHTESVGSIAFPSSPTSVKDLLFFFTGSQDRTIKMWDTSLLTDQQHSSLPSKLETLVTVKAHEKDINSLDVSPDDGLLASGSQDKTIKIYQIGYTHSKNSRSGELKAMGTFRGHKRGVWDVKFHPTEKAIASASGDKTIRIWNLTDFTCLKTLEEHTNSVLRVNFLSKGLQLVSSGSDGLVKVWNVNEERCLTTLDNHEDKVWALSISSDEKRIISGAGDSIVTIWEDMTEQQALERESERSALALREQSYINFVAINDYRNAFVLALSMDQPGRLLKLFRSLSSDGPSQEGSITGNSKVDGTISTLSSEDLCKLLRHVRSWNASTRTSEIAQRVLYAILKLRHHGDLEGLNNSVGDPENSVGDPRRQPVIHDLVDGLIPYTERHLHRLDRLVQESYVIDLIIGEMDEGLMHMEIIDQDDIFV